MNSTTADICHPAHEPQNEQKKRSTVKALDTYVYVGVQ
jgi:hypothetical protein